MLKLRCENNKLVLFKDTNELSFEISDKKYIEVIRKNIEATGEKECSCSIEKKAESRNFLILEWNEKTTDRKMITRKSTRILIPNSLAYEISSRMLLFNKTLKTPERNNNA